MITSATKLILSFHRFYLGTLRRFFLGYTPSLFLSWQRVTFPLVTPTLFLGTLHVTFLGEHFVALGGVFFLEAPFFFEGSIVTFLRRRPDSHGGGAVAYLHLFMIIQIKVFHWFPSFDIYCHSQSNSIWDITNVKWRLYAPTYLLSFW